MEIIIIILFVILILLLLYLVNISKNNTFDKELTNDLNKQINNLQIQIENKINNQATQLVRKEEVTYAKVENKLTVQNQQLGLTLNQVIERIAKIDNSQNQILNLTSSIENLEKILNDKKTRGIYGETQLKLIFQQIFGEKNDIIYSEQYKLSNKTIVDFVLHAPAPTGMICIDSKFPLENYLKMNEDIDKHLVEKYRKEFKQNVKKHINDIAEKYIITGETSTQALMFVPSESIFSEINGYHQDLVEYSYLKRVTIVSPTTIIAILNILQVVISDVERANSAKEIQKELENFAVEFRRFSQRWQNVMKSNDRLSKDLYDFNVTTTKINKKFEDIEKVNFGEINE